MKATDYSRNRQALTALLPRGSIAVIHSNDVLPTNADGTMRFRQNNDLYWLCGIRQEDTTLVLFPSHPDPRYRELLFIKTVDEQFVRWHGRRMEEAEAAAASGIPQAQVYRDEQFKDLFCRLVLQAEYIFLNATEHPRSENEVPTRNDRFARWCRDRFQLHGYRRLAPLLNRLRNTKSEAELQLMQTACHITEQGFRRLLGFVRPGVTEKQVEAELIHEYLQHGGEWADYAPIVASGADSCTLHYTANSKTCREGDILLIDAAASYLGYNADLTRSIPVSGRYSTRQRQVYDAVLSVHKALKDYARPGLYLKDIDRYARELLAEQLCSLGLVSTAALQEKGSRHFTDRYCYHGVSHFLGLDVHDTGDHYEVLPEHAVITIEPGIYIDAEGIGIRIENNIVLSSRGNTDLMADIPIEAEEIEELMQAGRR
jgi:Xaa-Pro aminopeptidase